MHVRAPVFEHVLTTSVSILSYSRLTFRHDDSAPMFRTKRGSSTSYESSINDARNHSRTRDNYRRQASSADNAARSREVPRPLPSLREPAQQDSRICCCRCPPSSRHHAWRFLYSESPSDGKENQRRPSLR